jgi:hypothetical protein
VKRRVARGVSLAGVPWLVGAVARGSLYWRQYGPLDAAKDYYSDTREDQ